MRWPLVALAAVLVLLGSLFVAAPQVALANHNPDPPTNLRTTSVADNQATIAWDAPSDATNVNHYEVRHKRTTDNTWTPAFQGQHSRVKTFFNLSPGTTYDVDVRSCQNLSTQHCSSTRTTFQFTTTAMPSRPENVRIATFTFTSVTVAWDAPASSPAAITSWGLEHREVGGSWLGTSQSDPAILQHVFSGLTTGATYEFRVRSLAAGSTASSWVTTAPLTLEGVDYDMDNDGLIEVANLAQLNAIRWDLDGNGSSTNSGYATAFPNAVQAVAGTSGNMGCPSTGCIGYELKNNLNFDEDNDGQITSADATYWNNGAGWAAIYGANFSERFSAIFEGNGFTISNLFINRNEDRVGLFGPVHGTLRNVGMLNVNVTNADTVGAYTGGLAAEIIGPVSGVFVTGRVEGASNTGGIAGRIYVFGGNVGTLSHSWSSADVHSRDGDAGGIAALMLRGSGQSQDPAITDSYVTGTVTAADSSDSRGGVLGIYSNGAITRVLSTASTGGKGLTTDPNRSPSGTGSYFDSDAAGTTEPAAQARTEFQLRFPHSNIGIYASWSATVWDFGNSRNYPVLRAPAGFDQDWDDTDGTATGAHTLFGNQREPQPPTTLRASLNAQNQIEFTWTAPTNTGSAPLGDYSYVATRGTSRNTGTTSTATHTITNPGAFNTFSVRATNGSAHGESAAISVGPPGAPMSATASADGDHIDVTWASAVFDPGTSQPRQFVIQHRVAGQDPEAPWRTQTAMAVPGRPLSAQIGDAQNPLIEGIEYDVRVAARNEMGVGEYRAANNGEPVTTNSTPVIALILNHEQVPVDPDNPDGPHQDVGNTTIDEGGDPGQLYAVMVHSEAQAARGHPPTTSPTATTIRVTVRTLDGQTGKFSVQGTLTLTIPANAEVSSNSIPITALDDAPDFQLESLVISGEVTSANANAVDGPDDIEITIVDDDEANYDLDGDGLIEIYNLAQLDAVRWDLNGNGTPADEVAEGLFPEILSSETVTTEDEDGNEITIVVDVTVYEVYLGAFAGLEIDATSESICGDSQCTGYELVRDLDFDTDGNGIIGGRQDDANENEAVDLDEDPDGNGVHDEGDRFWNVGNGWLPIGTTDTPYRGQFDGQGHTIANLFIDRSDSESAVGLFGGMELGDGEFSVRNLRLTVSAVQGADSVGAVTGSATGLITGVGVDVGTATVPGIENNVALGTVSGSNKVGGVAGSASSITDSWASVSVVSQGSAGGIAGEVSDSVERSFATGSLAGTENAGGLVGHLVGAMTDSYSTATVGSGSAAVGGLVGLNEGTIDNSYAAGPVDGTGGVAGDNSGSVTASYHASDITGQDGTRTAADLKSPTGASGIYADWDDTIWDFGNASQWPVLKVDLADSDETATWQEFGPQLRTEPAVTITTNAQGQPVVSWTAAAGHRSSATVTYQVYRGQRYVGEPLSATSYIDAGADATQLQQEYRVVALLDGQAARGSAVTLHSAHTVTLTLAPDTVEEDANATTVTVTASFEGSYTPPQDVVLNLRAGKANGQGMAIAGTHYTGSGIDDFTLTILSGSNSGTATFSIDPIDVSGVGGNVFVTVDGTADGLPGLPVGTATFTIQDNDILPTNTSVTLTPASIAEGGASTLRVTFSGRTTTGITTVTVTPPSGVTVDSMEKDVAAGTTSVTFTLTATDNNVVDGDRPGLTIGVVVQSSGTDNVVPPVTVPTLTVTDDDDAPTEIILTASPASVMEDGGGQTVRVTARFPSGSAVLTTATEVTLSVLPASTAMDPDDYAITPATSTVTISANAALSGVDQVASFTIMPVNNDDSNGARTIVLGATTAGTPAGFTVDPVTLPLRDDEGRILLRPSSLAVTEGGSAQTFTVELAEQPASNVVLSVEVLPDNQKSAISVSTSSITFTPDNWDSARTIRVTPRQDANSFSETLVIRYSAVDESSDDAFDGQTADVTVSVTDDDTPRVIITAADPLRINEGATRAYSVRLNTQPTGDVILMISSNNPGVTVDTDTTMDGNQNTLTFTPSDWRNNKTVRITAVQDDDAADETAILTHGAFGRVLRENGGYAGEWDPVNVEVNDDEAPGITIDTDPDRNGAQTALSVDEGGSATYTVVLDAQPTSNVTVTIAAAAPMGVTVMPATLTFTPTDWDTPKTVTVTAAEDPDNSANERVEFEHTGSGAAEYVGLAETLTVTAVDDDVPGLMLTALNPAEIAEGGMATYTVKLNVGPTADVVVAITSNNSDVTVADTDTNTEGDQNTLTFTGGASGNWNTPQTVTLNAAEDDDAVDDTFTIRHRIVDGQSASEYRPVADDTFTATVADDDTAGFTVDTDPATDGVQTAAVQVTEQQNTPAVTFTVVLDVQPGTGSVRINFASDDTSSVTVSPSSMTFSRSNWNTPRSVTMRGVNDADRDSEQVTVTLSVTNGTAANGFDGVAAQTVTVQVTDNDLADYDADDDGLIEITMLRQLNAIRWDLDGNGEPSTGNETAYATAFPNPVTGASVGNLGCPVAGCTGYELMADLSFALDDAWTPVGSDSDPYNADFDGNGHAILNLFINQSGDDVGLFGVLASGKTIRNVGLINVSVTGQQRTGALVGHSLGSISNSYVTGSVTGTNEVGGLVGRSAGSVVNTYAAGSVSANGVNVGGLVGWLEGSGQVRNSYVSVAVSNTMDNLAGLVGWVASNDGVVENSYYDSSVTPASVFDGVMNLRHGNAVRYSTGSTATINNVDGKTTAELQEPVEASGIYANWDAAVWDFGTSSQYPALKADGPDPNTVATWQEFGYQAREVPTITATAALDLSSVTLSWVEASNPWAEQVVSYVLYREGTQIAPAESATLTQGAYTDNTVTAGETYTYQVALLIDGVEHRRSAALSVAVTRDTDGDGLIDITTASQLSAIRYDLDGDGVADDAADAAAYARGMQVAADMTTLCPIGTNCTGYELSNDITLSGSWTPIGGDVEIGEDPSYYTGTFEGNGNTISGLRVNRGSSHSVGLFGATGPGAMIKNVCLESVNVRGLKSVGALVGQNRGTVSGSCSTGQVTGNSLVGGLVGWNRGAIERSYSEASVTGFSFTERDSPSGTVQPVWSTQLGGLVGQNSGTVRNTYATGDVTGVGHVAGLAGSVWNNGLVEFSYSVGKVSLDFEDWPFVGGLVGWVYGGRVESSVWNVETSGQEEGASQISLGGVFPEQAGKTTAVMQRPTTNIRIYVGWDSSIWNFGTSSDYPCLTGVGNCSSTAAPPQAQESPQPAQENRRASVTVAAPAPLTVAEGGTASYTVVLDGEPTGNVTITVSSDNANVTTEPVSLTFFPDNWQTPQTVTVHAAQDDDSAGDTANISHRVGGADEYAGIAVDAVAVSVTDDDTAGVKMWPEGRRSVTEGWTGSYQLSLDTRPLGEVQIYMFSDNPDVAPYPNPITFTPDNWDTVQLVGVPAAHDDDTADEEAVIIHAILADAGSGYEGASVPPMIVSIADDDTAGVTVRRTSLNLPEGWTGFYEVSLNTQPTDNVVIAVSSDNEDVTAYPEQLTFTPDNWQTAQTVTVFTAHDDDTVDDAATISHVASGDDEYAGIAVSSVAVSVTDDEPVAPGVTVFAADPVRVAEGGMATYEVVLDAQPTGNVTISMSSDNEEVTTQPTQLTFTVDNWQTAQTVTVRAAHDDDTTDDTATISHAVSGADEYAGIAVASVAVVVTDDDEYTAQPAQQEEPGSVSVSESNLSLREGDPGATYTVTLDVEPTENVVISVSSDNGDVTQEPSSLTFTPDNWQTAQTVTISAGEDDDQADDTAAISHQASGGNYDGVTLDSVTVSVTDDDTDREILRDLYDATGGANWATSTNWLSSQPLAEWHGVTTNGQGQVTHLVLRDNNLSGSLPVEIGKLAHLEVLSLDRNSISGSLPTELGDLSNLTRLAMNRNQLTGAIPSEFGDLSSLSILGLARNSLSGPLPTSLGNLSGLTRVSLHDNTGLSGELPAGISEMPGLTRLAVSRTGLSGQLPQGLINSEIQYLHFDDTGLCAPANEEFQTWLDGVPDKNGPTCE